MTTSDLNRWAGDNARDNIDSEPLLEGLWMIGSLSSPGYTLWGEVFDNYEK